MTIKATFILSVCIFGLNFLSCSSQNDLVKEANTANNSSTSKALVHANTNELSADEKDGNLVDTEVLDPNSSDKPDDLHYKGYRCRVDCSGHEAGYEWAERKGITDPDECGGNSLSFIEGCKSYAIESMGEESGDHDDEY